MYKNIPNTFKASAIEEDKLLRLESLSPAGATARVGFPCSFVESLRLHRQSFTLVNQVVQFFPPLQNCLNCTVLKNN